MQPLYTYKNKKQETCNLYEDFDDWYNKQEKDTFEKIFIHVEKKIITASAGNYYYTWYQIPEVLVGLPMYSIVECQSYIEKKLK